jgi:hypothetical protein
MGVVRRAHDERLCHLRGRPELDPATIAGPRTGPRGLGQLRGLRPRCGLRWRVVRNSTYFLLAPIEAEDRVYDVFVPSGEVPRELEASLMENPRFERVGGERMHSVFRVERVFGAAAS